MKLFIGDLLPIRSYVFAFFILLGFYPSFAWELPFDASGIASAAIALICFLSSSKEGNKLFPLFFFILYVWMCIRSELSIMGVLSVLMTCSLFICSKKCLYEGYRAFHQLFAILMLISIIVYILVIIFSLPIPNSTINPLNDEKQYITYYRYPFLVVANPGSFLAYRFASIFDEPGVIGTICGVILLIEDFNFKKHLNVILLVAGLLSFSLFFYIIMVIYIIMFKPLKFKIISIVSFSVVLYFLSSNEVFSTLIFDRIQLDDGFLSGDTRSHVDDSWYSSFQKTKDYLWGLGGGMHFIYNYGGCSYKDVVIDYGIVYLIIYIFTFVIYFRRCVKNKQQFLSYLLLVVSVLYQRPFINNISYVFLLLAPIIVATITDEKGYYKDSMKV